MTVRFLLGATSLLVLVGQSWAGESGEATATSLERSRIAAERAEVERGHQVAQSACHQRFAVNDCLKQASEARRTRLEDLKQQRLRVDAEQRKREAAESKQRIEAKRESDVQLALANTRKYEERQTKAERRRLQKEAKALQRSKPRSNPLPGG